MALSDGDLAWVRSEVGAVTDDAALNAAHDRLGGRAAVALEVWRRRYADFLRVPASLSADGAGQNTTANLAEMRQTIARLALAAAQEAAEADGYGSAGQSGFLSRPDRRGQRPFSEEQALTGYCR